MTQKLIIGIGPRISVELTGETPQDVIKQAAFYSQLPDKCPVCGTDVYLTYRKPKGFDYYGLRCVGSPSHEANFGEYQEKALGMYYKEQEGWHEVRRGQDAGFEQEPVGTSRAEHDRLDAAILEAYKKSGRSQPFAEAVQARYNKRPEQLTIEEKQTILERLTGI